MSRVRLPVWNVKAEAQSQLHDPRMHQQIYSVDLYYGCGGFWVAKQNVHRVLSSLSPSWFLVQNNEINKTGTRLWSRYGSASEDIKPVFMTVDVRMWTVWIFIRLLPGFNDFTSFLSLLWILNCRFCDLRWAAVELSSFSFLAFTTLPPHWVCLLWFYCFIINILFVHMLTSVWCYQCCSLCGFCLCGTPGIKCAL